VTGKCVLAGGECPQTADPTSKRYCPAWWETLWKDEQGETHLRKGCGWTQLPLYLNEFARASSQASVAAVEAREQASNMGAQVAQGFRTLALTTMATASQRLEGPSGQVTFRLPPDQGHAQLAGIRDNGAPDVPRDSGSL